MTVKNPDTKVCATCGRTITWRKKWAANWDSVRYCSQGCRRHRPGELDQQLEEAIEALLAQRKGGATVDPAEAARSVGGQDWQELMEPARAAARRLTAAGRVELIQNGVVVDPSTARGTIGIRRVRSG